VHNIWIVNNRLASRYLVRGLGFCDLNSPDLFRTAIGTVRSWVSRLVWMLWVSIGVDAIRPVMLTDLFQRFVELMLAFPLNVYPSQLSKFDKRFFICDHEVCVLDQWNSAAAAADSNNHDYAEYNKPESSR